MRRAQRGETDGGSLLIFVLVLFLLCWGEPDVWDGLQAWAKLTVAAAKVKP